LIYLAGIAREFKGYLAAEAWFLDGSARTEAPEK
jgi:hypothetical protein